MGGTNILSALTAILEGESSGQSNRPKNASCPRQLFILSDGVMDNKTVDILDLLRKHSDNMTAFTFGIGGKWRLKVSNLECSHVCNHRRC